MERCPRRECRLPPPSEPRDITGKWLEAVGAACDVSPREQLRSTGTEMLLRAREGREYLWEPLQSSVKLQLCCGAVTLFSHIYV